MLWRKTFCFNQLVIGATFVIKVYTEIGSIMSQEKKMQSISIVHDDIFENLNSPPQKEITIDDVNCQIASIIQNPKDAVFLPAEIFEMIGAVLAGEITSSVSKNATIITLWALGRIQPVRNPWEESVVWESIEPS